MLRLIAINGAARAEEQSTLLNEDNYDKCDIRVIA